MRAASRVLKDKGLDRGALQREMETPYFVPESTPLHTQLLNFQQKKNAAKCSGRRVRRSARAGCT